MIIWINSGTVSIREMVFVSTILKTKKNEELFLSETQKQKYS